MFWIVVLYVYIVAISMTPASSKIVIDKMIEKINQIASTLQENKNDMNKNEHDDDISVL